MYSIPMRERVNKHHKPTIDIKCWKIIISNPKMEIIIDDIHKTLHRVVI